MERRRELTKAGAKERNVLRQGGRQCGEVGRGERRVSRRLGVREARRRRERGGEPWERRAKPAAWWNETGEGPGRMAWRGGVK